MPRLILRIALLALLCAGSLALARRAVVPPAALAQAVEPLNLDLQLFVPPRVLEAPTDIAHAGDSRLFVVERAGRIRVVRPDGSVQGPPFLDISGRVRLVSRTEQGLLGLTFHPNFAQNGFFYVNYTAEPDGATRISRFSVSANPNLADRHSEHVILIIPQPFPTHNGGDLLFGPQDGYLYIPTGDGGQFYDPGNRAQNASVLLGKVLRIDVDEPAVGALAPDCGTTNGHAGAYTIPPDNPFANSPAGLCDEIWALGLRNPWRASFDRQTGDLYIADVGEAQWEEINRQPAASGGGQNYAWRCYEGTQLVSGDFLCEDVSRFTMPVFQYAHTTGDGCAVTGGYVYRGWRYPDMRGRYYLLDFCSGYLWDIVQTNAWSARRYTHLSADLSRSVTFGEDVHGELFIANLSTGAVYRLVEDSLITAVDPHLFLPLVSN